MTFVVVDFVFILKLEVSINEKKIVKNMVRHDRV